MVARKEKDDMKRHKYERVLDIVFALESGKQLSKYELAATYEVDVRTIQRDIDDVRAYYSDAFLLLGVREVIYDRTSNRYKLSA